MEMSRKHRALYLADLLDRVWMGGVSPEVADELRKLHHENQRMLGVLKIIAEQVRSADSLLAAQDLAAAAVQISEERTDWSAA
jgi:hypothetical protein